ncbi:MAG: ornithine cyclodeaminase family protein [Tepidibacter sp.]|jgi:ornithine cyclodeaminase|uniref:ornithine cyclodeaminase family protein n=1 Tax=Tepidibacter sp. TaxID=2529387 RepID=UPI0025D7DF7D|nr:ornithine cyclodeaminase family protein [Tepidibacter sp.]MCT4508078.1 ornithine cyclodeaminase family protein [Tepidibacter sp.]
MLLLNKQDIDKVFSMGDAIEADKRAFEIFSNNESVVPLRTKLENTNNNGINLFMPGYVEKLDNAGIKIVSIFPENSSKNKPVVPASMILIDNTTGEVNCILDGTYLTQIRTGAASGAATDILARKDSRIGALFGTGGQAYKQLEAVLEARELELVKVYGRNKEKTQKFVDEVKIKLCKYKTQIIAAKDADDAVIDADIITLATSSNMPVFNGELVKKGCHINGIGSFTPQMQEMDEYIISNADKIYVDSVYACLEEAGDIIIPLDKGIIQKDRIDGELGEVINKTIEGRENDEEITIFKSVGIAVQDIVTANRIYQKAIECGIGSKVDI